MAKPEKSAHGLPAIKALFELQRAGRRGETPDPSAVKLIGEAFTTWLATDDATSLDEILGIQARRGADPVPRQLRREVRDWVLMSLVGELRLLGLSVERACEAIAAIYTARGITLSLKSVRDIYYETGGSRGKAALQQTPAGRANKQRWILEQAVEALTLSPLKRELQRLLKEAV